MNSWSTAFLQMSALVLCASDLFCHLLCEEVPVPAAFVELMLHFSSTSYRWWIPWWWFFGDESNVRRLITENVFLWSRCIPCVQRQSFVAAEQGTRTRNHCKLTGNVRQPSTIVRFHVSKMSRITHRIHLFLASPATDRWAFCIVSWLSLNFGTENSSTRSSWALFISPILCTLRIGVSRRSFSFIDNSSCSRTCSHLDSTNQYSASCHANRCSSVCRCSSPMHLLRVSTWISCFARSDRTWLNKWSLLPSRRDPLKIDGLAFLNTELLIRFPCSDGNNALGFTKAFWPWDVWDVKLSFRSAWVYCALTSLSCTTNASGFRWLQLASVLCFSSYFALSRSWSFGLLCLLFGIALLPAVGFALVLPAVSFALLGSFHPCSRSSMFFSLSSYPCCFTSFLSPQARGLWFRLGFFFRVTLWRLRLRGSFLASPQHHYSALRPSRLMVRGRCPRSTKRYFICDNVFCWMWGLVWPSDEWDL